MYSLTSQRGLLVPVCLLLPVTQFADLQSKTFQNHFMASQILNPQTDHGIVL